MEHLVQQKIRAVGRRARWLTLAHGWSWFAGITLLAILLACVVDYFFRIQEHGLRFILTTLALAVAGWSGLRWLRPALGYRPTDVQVALRIERRIPELGERLSSAVEFLKQPVDDPRAGSTELRRAVIADAEGQVAERDLFACLDGRRTRNAGWAVLGLVALIAAIIAVDLLGAWPRQRGAQPLPSSVLAMVRFVAPWSNVEWPRWNQLRFVKQPELLAQGGDFEVELVDGQGHLPDVVEMEYWFEGDAPGQIQSKLMKPTPEGSMVHRLENVTRSFQYRAVGGDHHNMPWIALRLVESPQITSHEVTLHPPAYTGREAISSGPRIDALVGTEIEVRGKVSKPLKSVRVRSPADKNAEKVQVRLDEDRLGFVIARDAGWKVAQSGTYWFELLDEEGVPGGQETTWEIRAQPDNPPTVSLELPDANAFLTAQARPQVKAVVKDDLAVERIELRFLRSDASEAGEQTHVVYQGPATATSATTQVGEGQGGKQVVDTRWDLSQLAGLKPGDWIDFHVAASDYKPQWGQSTTRRLTVISEDQLEDRLSQRQAQILSQLAEVLRLQQSARSQTQSLEIQLKEAGKLANADLDQLQSSELNQRQVGRQLADSAGGIPSQIRQLLEELESNRVDNPDVFRRMNDLLQGLDGVSRELMPRVQRDLVEALKTAREQIRDEPDADQPDADQPDAAQPDADQADADQAAVPLRRAGEGQDEVVAALENMLGELTQWDSYRSFAREIHRLQRDQQKIRDQTDQLRLDTLSKEPRDLSGQEKADLKRLAQRQIEMARQFDKIQGRMQQMQQQLQPSDPLAAETLEDAIATSRRLAISGQMRESGRSIEDNRVGQAARQQQQIADSMEELLDVLANRREHELDRLLSQLRRSADDLAELQRQQSDWNDQLKSTAAGEDAEARAAQLRQQAKRQQQLAEESHQLARRLQRLQAAQAGQHTADASQSQQQAAQSAQQDQAADAQQQAADAQQQLGEAQQQLQQRVQQLEQDLFEEQMARLEQLVGGLIMRQEGLLNTTAELHTLQEQQQGEWRRGQLVTLGDLASQQRGLATETGILAEKVSQAKAFTLGLEGTMREMARASRGLDRRDAGPDTQQAETAALTRLRQLAEALKKDANNPPAGEPQPEEPQQGQGMPQQDAVRLLAELKLIKLLQQEILQRTEQLETLRVEAGSWTQEQQLEADDLAQEQGRLAELVTELMQSATAAMQEPSPDESKQTTEEPPEEPPGSAPEEAPEEAPEKPPEAQPLDKTLEQDLLKDV